MLLVYKGWSCEIEKDVHIHDPSESQNVNVIYIRECIIGNYTDVLLQMHSLFLAWLFQQNGCVVKIFRADTPAMPQSNLTIQIIL